MTADNIKVGDTIEASYLPKSTVVLKYKNTILSGDGAEYPDEEGSGRSPTYILFSVWFALIAIFIIYNKATNVDEKLEYRILKDEKKLTDRVVKYHRSHIIIGISILSACIVVMTIHIVLAKQYVYLFMPVMSGIIGFGFICTDYRNNRIEYDEKGIVIYPLNGRKIIVSNDNILSVEKKYDSIWLRRGKPLRVVEIYYRFISPKNGRTYTEALTLCCNNRIGLTNFYDFYMNNKCS